MNSLRAAACLAAVTWMAGPRAAAGPVPTGIRPAAPDAPAATAWDHAQSAVTWESVTAPAAPAIVLEDRAAARRISGKGMENRERPGSDEPRSWTGPEDPDRITGLGYADKRVHPLDYRDRARSAALARIARALSASVRAVSSASRRENGDGYQEDWSDSSVVSSEVELAGYRLERSRETAEGYWALYVLDREEYARAQALSAASFAAWLEARAGDIESGLDARRLQSARDAAAAADDSLGRRAGIPPGAEKAWESFRRASERLRAAVRGSRWSPSAPWRYSLPMANGARPAPPRLRLIDSSGAEWRGPYRITIHAGGKGGRSCDAWTDDEGIPDPAGPFVRCGLPEGIWALEWRGPAGDPIRTEAEAAWLPVEVRIEVGQAPGYAGWAAGKAARERLRAGLAGRCGPRYRAVTAEAEAEELAVVITGTSLDSLEGMRFASLRGEMRLPGRAGSIRINGKGGHADPARARERAMEDFLGNAAEAIGND